jgi:serine/threonine protein kinase
VNRKGLEQQFAIKQVLIPQISEYRNDDELLEMQFINYEIETLSELNHPLISELLEVYADTNFLYMVSPFYSGGEVADLLYDDEVENTDVN